MKRVSIEEQLKTDYPDREIIYNANDGSISIDQNLINLMMDKEEIAAININSRSGRNYYQAIVQFLYEKYAFSPSKQSYADSLITFKEDYDKYRIQNLAKDYKIGFLEDGESVIAVPINGSFNEQALIEEDKELQGRIKVEKLKKEAGLEDDFGYLLDIENSYIPQEKRNKN